MPPPLIGEGIKRWCCLTSVCPTVTYIGPKSRNREAYRKTKIGTEVAHVTRDSDTAFKVKGQGHQTALLIAVLATWHVRRLQRWAWERVGRVKLLLRCRLLGGARRFGAHGEGEGQGISWRPPAYNLLHCMLLTCERHIIRVRHLHTSGSLDQISCRLRHVYNKSTTHPQQIAQMEF